MNILKSLSLGLLLTLLLVGCEDLIDTTNTSDITQNMEGQWECDESSSVYKSTNDIYSVYISPSETDTTKVYISNFYQLGSTIEAEATVNGNAITLNSQSLDGDFEVRGSGTISSNLQTITWTYYVDDGSGQEDAVTATYTFQY